MDDAKAFVMVFYAVWLKVKALFQNTLCVSSAVSCHAAIYIMVESVLPDGAVQDTLIFEGTATEEFAQQ